MNARTVKGGVALCISVLLFSVSISIRAQDSTSSLSGTITSATGATVPNAKVTIKNLATGQPVETQTDSSGRYTVPNLTPGDYELDVSAEGYSTNTMKVAIAQASINPPT